MRNLILLTTIILGFSLKSYPQDKIFTHRGDTLTCKVTEMGEKFIKYQFVGEDLLNSISNNRVSKVVFGSGRIQEVSEKIIISSVEDWKKVQITNLESDVQGLKRVREIMAKASSGWSFTNQGKMEAEAMDKLKQQAAASGCHIVLILTTTGQGGHSGFSGGAKASVTGVAYKY